MIVIIVMKVKHYSIVKFISYHLYNLLNMMLKQATNQINVLYRRNSGGVGHIMPKEEQQQEDVVVVVVQVAPIVVVEVVAVVVMVVEIIKVVVVVVFNYGCIDNIIT